MSLYERDDFFLNGDVDADIDYALKLSLARPPRDLDVPAYPLRGVYFVACAGFIKIGISDSVTRRLVDLGRVIPIPVTPLGWLPCPGDRVDLEAMEHRLHAQFAPFRTTGEWFMADETLTAFIAAQAQSWPP